MVDDYGTPDSLGPYKSIGTDLVNDVPTSLSSTRTPPVVPGPHVPDLSNRTPPGHPPPLGHFLKYVPLQYFLSDVLSDRRPSSLTSKGNVRSTFITLDLLFVPSLYCSFSSNHRVSYLGRLDWSHPLPYPQVM